jgi:hypothetical protein
VLDWTKSEWSLNNMVAETQNMDDVCKVPEPKNIPFPEKRKMHEHDQERNVTSSNIKKTLLHNKL